ncbi:MAG TPA: ATP-grasp domain-containing protein [Polyangiaceae bacterium]|nr:ATP-grasp domain-containing protein [Polyangiaceae bacterium]
MQSKRVGVLMGGSSAERETSLRSGRAVALALEESGREVVRIELNGHRDPADAIRKAGIDAAFIAHRGSFGEDGCVQGLLELLRIPYTGSGVLESALAMDKLKSKELFRLHNVPTPAYYVYRGVNDCDAILDVHGSFGFPAVVKPRRASLGLGARCATDASALVALIGRASGPGHEVLVERWVRGIEITVGVLNGRVLGACETARCDGVSDARRDQLAPARMTPALYNNVLCLAERAMDAIGATGAVTVRMLLTDTQNEFVLEVDPLPSLVPNDLFASMATAAGYGFVELCEAILGAARLHLQVHASERKAEIVPIARNEEYSLKAVAG